MTEENHHVHFYDEGSDAVDDHKTIRIQAMGADRAIVHLGFMQVNHRYSVQFEIPRSLLPKSEHIREAETETPNLNCRLVTINDGKDDATAEVKVEFSALKAKLQKEIIVLEGEEEKQKMTMVLQARVLGKGKGTPLLHDGIKMVEVLPDPDQSDVGSDWQGF